MEPEEYELFAQRSQRRRRAMFIAALGALVAVLYVPWIIVSAGLLSDDTAEMVSVLDALLVIACWRGLTLRLSESDGAERAAILGAGAGVAGAIAVLAAGSLMFGFIGSSGVIFSLGLVFVLGGMVARALIFRAVKRGI